MKKRTESIELPLITRKAEITSFDEKTRTAEMVFASEAKVTRFDFFDGFFKEELSMNSEDVRQERVENGAVPFLKNHGDLFGARIEDVMGKVLEVDFDGNKATGKVKFSKRDDVQPFIEDIKDGILSSVSVGFRIHKLEKVGEEENMPIMRATDWEILEVSSVAIPADSSAQFRKEDSKQKFYRCEVIGMDLEKKELEKEVEPKVEQRSEEVQPEGSEPQPSPEKEEKRDLGEKKEFENSDDLPEDKKEGEISMDKEQIRQEAIKEERERSEGISKAVRAAKLEDSFGQKLIADGVSLDEARTLVLEELAKQDSETNTRSQHVTIQAGELDEKVTRKEGLQEAFMSRAFGSKVKVTERSKPWMGLSILESAREFLRQEGVNVSGMSRLDVAKRALHTTSDFPEILANTANKSLRDSYMEAPQTFMPFTNRVQVADFKEISRTQLGDAPSLLAVPESGEIKDGTIGENAEKYSVEEYARKISISRKTLVNDDLSAFTRVPAAMGRAARDLESDTVWAIITANAALSDGNALFSAAHNNLTTGPGAAPDIDELNKGRSAMRSQVGINGRLINVQPAWLIVPAALETVGEQLVSTISPEEFSKVNPFGPQGRTPLQLIVEPRLDSDSLVKWYLSASLNQIDMIELATLEGTDGPEVSSEEMFDTLGMKIRVVHSIGAKAIDFRGLYRNDGA